MKMASVFGLVILVVSMWKEAIAGRATQLFESENHHSRRNLIENGLGSKPPMGWDSWYHFYCEVNDQTIRAMADAMVTTGLSAAGYEYIIIDDCWGQPQRDNQGKLVASPSAFPSGIKAVADYVHSKGLKIGIYAEAGSISCTNSTAGSLGHEGDDAITFDAWGIDYVKYDNCNNDGTLAKLRFATMSTALAKTGRPIFFSVCDWGVSEPASWAPQIANSWRTTTNVDSEWSTITAIADQNDQWAPYSGPGAWNDPDVIEIGNGNLTIEEYRSQFSLWALMKAPLILGADLTTLSPDNLAILTNQEVIAVNQDALGIQGKKVGQNGDFEVWAGPLSNGRTVVVLLNRSGLIANVTASWKDLGLPGGAGVKVRDIWEHKDFRSLFYNDISYTNLEPHTCKMYVLTIVVRP